VHQAGVDANKLWQGFFITGCAVHPRGVPDSLGGAALPRRSTRSGPDAVHTLFEIIYTVVPIVMVLVLSTSRGHGELGDAVPASNVQVNVTPSSGDGGSATSTMSP